MAIPALVGEITGREDIPPDAFKQEPQGNRITVLLDRAPETYGGILHLPKTSMQLELIGAGLVIGVGPQAGDGVPYPAGPLCHPSQLLYRHISFGAHTGKALRFSVRETRYEAAVLVMCDRDVWTIDWDDEPYAGEQEEFAKFNAEAARRAEEEKAAGDRLAMERRMRAKLVNTN
jgi:hypothetical protein